MYIYIIYVRMYVCMYVCMFVCKYTFSNHLKSLFTVCNQIAAIQGDGIEYAH